MSQWWKFSLGDMGTHLVRVINVGTEEQEVWLDGSPLDAPPGTMTFTGPQAVLLELHRTDSGWMLLVDGLPVESYNPDVAAASPAVCWWKFTVDGIGTHHLRVTGIGSADQQVSVDGTPVDAPPGTMMFTGPGGSLLELQRREGVWVLLVNSACVHQHNPAADNGDVHVWSFLLPTSSHQVRVSSIGRRGQEIHLDGQLVPAPEGTAMFTGPAATLLELQQRPEGWVLTVDGELAHLVSGPGGTGPASGPVGEQASWTFLIPHTGSAHQVRVDGIGSDNQVVFIDGNAVPAPPGTTTFTGPGGTLLELRSTSHGWTLCVDGLGVEDYNARASTLVTSGVVRGASGAAPGPDGGRSAVDLDCLPQGVSLDSETGMFRANIKVRGKFKHLGDFASPQEAHARYLAAKKDLDGS